MGIEGADTVGYYHDEAGPHEVFRLTGDPLTPMQQWALTITFDVLNIIVGIFGIVTSVPKVQNAINALAPKVNQLVLAVQNAYNISDSALVKAKKVSMAVMSLLSSSDLLWTVIEELVTGSWWSLAFTITNTVLMIVLTVATEGAALAIRIVQMGVLLGQLAYDISQKPSTEAVAAA
jgi:hypothetical protein